MARITFKRTYNVKKKGVVKKIRVIGESNGWKTSYFMDKMGKILFAKQEKTSYMKKKSARYDYANLLNIGFKSRGKKKRK